MTDMARAIVELKSRTTRPEKPFLKGCAGKAEQKTSKKIAKDCKRLKQVSKSFRTIRQLYFFKNRAIKKFSSKPETIQQQNKTKKRYVEGCACAGAALKRITMMSTKMQMSN